MMSDANFKCCRNCGVCWPTAEAFVLDPALAVRGYQACLGEAEDGLLLVTHAKAACGTTLAVTARSLRELYQGPEYTEFCQGTAVCECRCLHEGDLETCSAPCAMAWVREVLQYLRRHELPTPVSQ